MRPRNCFLLAGLGLLAACGPESPKTGAPKGPEAPPSAAAPAPANLFSNITSQSGVRFTHQAGTNYSMPDQVGSGITLFDFDQDGRLDLYFTQNGGPGSPHSNRLFHQEADNTFKDVSEGSGVDVAGHGMGSAAGDVNNDGLPDLVLTEYGATRLFQNLGGGRFRETTKESGIDNPRWAAPASFVDFDRDGWLDIVVGNYVDYDPTQICHDQHGRQDFCAPKAFAPTATRLWRNVTKVKGAPPRFEDWTARSGLSRNPGVALGLVCADFTGDHWPDILCADDGRPNRLFVNQRNGTFLEEAAPRGLGYDAMGRTAANMGVVFADFDGDGMGDLFITHLTEEFHSLYRQDKPGVFIDVIGQSGIQQGAWRGTGFGAVAADFDLDGAADLAIANGLVRRAVPGQTPVMAGVQPFWAPYSQRPQLFLNKGAKLSDVSQTNPNFCGEAAVGRSLAVGDLDNDGAPDLVLGCIGGPAQIYRNVGRGERHWLKARLVNPAAGGRDAIGAEVRLKAGGRQWWSVLQPATSYLSSHDPALIFGLGDLKEAQVAEVIWPEGEAESFKIGAVDRLIVLKKGSGEKIEQ